MENLEADTAIGEMSASERNNETARLVGPPAAANPSYLNLTSNICGLVFLGIIFYCSFRDGPSLFSFHPALMTIGWLVLMPCAINAVTPGDLATEWMPIRLRSARHWVIQILAGVVISLGFIVIVTNKFLNTANHFVTLHAKFGLATVILMYLTKSGGIGALYSLKLKHYLSPMYTKLIHASVGLVTFSLGVITIILGLFSKWFIEHFNEALQYSGMVLVLAVMVFTVLRPTLKIYFRIKERIDNSN